MEGNLRPGTPHPLPAGNVGRDYELTRSNSDASVLTAENGKDILCCSANAVPDDCSAWTDEKHNLYLHRLEVSFVEQLKQSKNLLAQFLVENQRHTNISEKQLTNMSNAFEKFNVLWNGGWQKINCVIGEPFSSSVSADSRTPIKSKGICNFKHMRVHYPPSSAEMPEFTKLCSREKHGKRIISHGFLTCSQQFSSGNPYQGDLFDLKKEGMGQNFLDEDNQNISNSGSRAKRLRTISAIVIVRIKLCLPGNGLQQIIL
ncbi:UNVERIFIED_CONTAM: Cold-regulated protein 28 [Sesamum angustifolium]|uniref:Cold-regulated protein 28 n=1 Tax=Sesamum angustifolium TaxID=2727405 RepID=A0AAW2QDM6_9LAMI